MASRGELQRRTTGPDSSGFERVYATHHSAVLAYCARRASRSDAWDAAAEVFTVAWRRRSDIPDGDEALPWLLGVAYRVLCNQRRSERRRQRLTVRIAKTNANSPPAPDAQLIRNEDEAEVIAALGRLRAVDREVILLTLWEELPRHDIAAVLGISRAAVDQRFSRAKRRLSRELRRPGRNEGYATPHLDARGGAT